MPRMTGRPRTWWWIMLGFLATGVISWTGFSLMPRGPLAWLGRPMQQGLSRDVPEPSPVEKSIQLQEQLVRANAENALLRSRLQDYLSIKGEGGVPPDQTVVVRARVVARTLRQGRRYCELDAGAVDGVVSGMAVCLGWSLVGTVAGVQEGRCLVQQVTDSESRIPASLLMGEAIIAEGVLSGVGKRGLLQLDYIEDRRGLVVEAGQRIITAGTDGRFPSGLILGTVTAASRSATADHWHVEVVPLREADTAESLLILRHEQRNR
jgi:rod shape-determining protein MreC